MDRRTMRGMIQAIQIKAIEERDHLIGRNPGLCQGARGIIGQSQALTQW
jgi:hypothetical protein